MSWNYLKNLCCNSFLEMHHNINERTIVKPQPTIVHKNIINPRRQIVTLVFGPRSTKCFKKYFKVHLFISCWVSVNFSLEMFYLNTIEQLFLFVEQLDQLEVCLAYRRLLAGIPILAVFQNLRWNSNKTSLYYTKFIS